VGDLVGASVGDSVGFFVGDWVGTASSSSIVGVGTKTTF
jgi:hypothetical protein